MRGGNDSFVTGRERGEGKLFRQINLQQSPKIQGEFKEYMGGPVASGRGPDPALPRVLRPSLLLSSSFLILFLFFLILLNLTSLVAQMVKRQPAMQETQVRSLGQEDPCRRKWQPNSSTLAWRIPWMEEPGGLQFMGLQRVGHDWATSLSLSEPEED